MAICKEARSTPASSPRRMAVKGFDTGDKVLAKAVEHRLPRRSHNSQRFPLAGLLAPVPR